MSLTPLIVAGSQEYNDFERDWVQRLKHGYPIKDTWYTNGGLLESCRSIASVRAEQIKSKRQTFRELLAKYIFNNDK